MKFLGRVMKQLVNWQILMKSVITARFLCKLQLLLVTSLLSIPIARADLNSQLDEVFGTMSNTTNPNAFETERRGIISGGSYSMRAPIKSLNIASFTPPSASSGCSGIDLYGGSFSYINKEEFIAFMRSIAANAQGYAFQIALSSMCEKCSQHMETLQKKLQLLNQYFGNSCQLAQGIVNDSLSAFDRKGLNDASLIGQFEGIGDLFELNTAKSSSEVFAKAQSVNPEEVSMLSGNIMWQALLENPVINSDKDLAQAVMSITGTIITDSSNGEITVVPAGLISISSLIEGGELPLYRCNTISDGGCLEISIVPKNIQGIGKRIYSIFIGNGSTLGIIDKLAQNTGNLSTNELNIVNNLPPGFMSKIRTLSAKNASAAHSLIITAAPYLAYNLTLSLMDDFLSNCEAQIRLSKHSHAELMLDQIHSVKDSINTEKLVLAQSYGNESAINTEYELLLKNIAPTVYTIIE